MPEPRTITVLADDVDASVPGMLEGQRAVIASADLVRAIGWARKPEGLCRGDMCVPVRDMPHGDTVDLVAVAARLDRAVVVDGDAGVVALGAARAERRTSFFGGVAPAFTLPDLDGVSRALTDWDGRKRLVVAFSSWCGCRYDLPGWQELHDELSGDGLQVIPVAIDEAAEDVRPFTDGMSVPVLLDRHHLLTDLYAISNVPTVIWIDEAGKVVRPNTCAFGTDTFADFTGVHAGPHLDAIRRWVRDDEIDPCDASIEDAVGDLTDDEEQARLWFRIGAHLRRSGRADESVSRFARAAALAPHDFTVRRAALPLVGDDPFGPTFFAFYEEWQEAGMPFHGFPADRSETGT